MPSFAGRKIKISMKTLKQFARNTSVFLTGAVGHYYVSKVLESKENKEKEVLDQNFRDETSKTLFRRK